MPRQESQTEVICIPSGSDLEHRVGLVVPKALPQAQGTGREQPMRKSGHVVTLDHTFFNRPINVVSGINEQISACFVTEVLSWVVSSWLKKCERF